MPDLDPFLLFSDWQDAVGFAIVVTLQMIAGYTRAIQESGSPVQAPRGIPMRYFGRPRDSRDASLEDLQRKVGELVMANERLQAELRRRTGR